MLRLRHGLAALVLAFAVPACGGDDNDGKQGQGPNEQEETGQASKEISAEEGGELKLGAAKLAIPGGALAEDLTVTVQSTQPASSLPSGDSLKGLVYDFGPDGTEFEKPATLTLPAAGSPGEGKEAVIAWLDPESGEWQDLETSAGSGGTLSAEISHFTLFVVRFVDAEGNGSEVSCDFTACGGDPVGTWTVAGACFDTGTTNPFEETCADSTFGVDLEATGTLKLTDNEFTWDLAIAGHSVINLPASCLSQLTNGQPIECEEFGGDESECTGSYTTGCSCRSPIEPNENHKTGTYEVQGNTLVATADDEDEPSTPSEFCVRGDQLKMQTVETDEEDGTTSTVTLTLTR